MASCTAPPGAGLADLARHGWQVTVIDDVVADPPASDAAGRAPPGER